jgi:hypothetical protein
MVFGLDDILEGVVISDILYFIGSALFSETAVASSVEGTSLVVQDLLGDTGLEAVIDLAKNETTGLLANEINVPLFQQEGVSLWEEEGLTQSGNLTKNGFIDRVKTIAKGLSDKGVNIGSTEGRDVLRKIVKKAIELGKSGVKEALKPKYIIPAVLGSGGIAGVGGAIKLFKKKARRALKPLEPLIKPETSQDLMSDLP